MVVIMRLDIRGCRHMICRIASRLLRICLRIIRATIMVVGVVLRTITGAVGRLEGLGLGIMTSITVNVDLFYVLVSLISYLVIIACQSLFSILLSLDLNFGLDFDSFQARRCMDTKIPLLSGVVHD